MTYSLNIDQEFAVMNGLTLVQASALAAFMTLPLWSECITFEGAVWYRYSDENMAKDFPLLFGIPKRCYKNAAELEALGLIGTTKLGKDKYVRFLDPCSQWNREKSENGPIVQKRTPSPKTDQKKSENGPATPILNNYNINTITLNDKKENKNNVFIKEKNDPDGFFREALIGQGVTPEVADAFMLVRKKARAVNSSIALSGLLREIGRAGISADEAIRFAVEWSWRGFRAEWYFNKTRSLSRGTSKGGDALRQNLATLRSLENQSIGGNYDEQ